MAIALVGNAKASASGSSTPTTSGADTTGSNLLVVVACMYSRSATSGSATVSDSKSNTWTALSNYVNGNSNICIWYAKNPTVGTAHTFSLNPGGTGYPLIMAIWYSGADTTAPLDTGQVAGFGAASATIQPGSVTPSVANCLVISGISNNSATDQTISAPFTRQDNSVNASFETGAWAYEIQTTATARNPTWTTASDTGAKASSIAVFKPAGGGGGGSTYNDSIALGAGAHVGDTAAASIAASLALGAGAHVGDSIAATIAASLALGAAGGTSDGAAATVATSGTLGVQAGTTTNAQAVIAAAVAAGIAQAFAATNGSVYTSSIGLGAAAATGAGATLGLSLSAALAAQHGVSATPAVSAQAIAVFGSALTTNPQAVLTVASQIGAGIGAGIAAQSGLVFADSIALGAFAQAVAQQVAGVVAIVGRTMLSDAPVFRAVITDSLAGNATVSDSPVGGATIDEL